jgi:hypothetical protein
VYSLTQDKQFIDDLKNSITIRWHNVRHSQGLREGHGANGQICPLTQLAVQLTKIIEEAGDTPFEEYRPCLRQMIRDMQFIDESGDSVIDEHEMQIVEREVTLLVDIMESVRKLAVRRGALSHCTTTCAPPMFG